MTDGKDAETGRRLGTRAMWWVFLRTLRDQRLNLAQGRPISSRNLCRSLQREMGDALGRHVLEREIQLVMQWLISREGINVTDDTIQTFRQAFAQLKGQPEFVPFPWQERLFASFINGVIPSCLDIPTGLGKTSVIETWLLAHRFQKKTRPPMRLVYVVNRRTIVDQATTIAQNLKEVTKDLAEWKDCLGPDGLAVSALRGALADNREWMERPHRPAIIIGTVDMIGSRLLFDAYRAGKWTKAMHAGLLGQDSLIVHDEAHLSQPFQKLLEWICDQQAKDGSPLSMRLLAMSATGLKTKEPPLGLAQKDYDLPAVQKKTNAIKRLKVHPFDQKIKVPDRIADIAATYDREGESAKRVIVFVRTPDVALKICNRLKEKHNISTDRIELLTGTIRGHERDELVKRPVLVNLFESNQPLQTEYLVATSAGEVGADFDADHLVCDATMLDSMIQRFGRVNRRGNGDALIDVLVDFKESDKLKEHEKRMLRTADWLGRLPLVDGDNDSRRLASPEALRAHRESDIEKYLESVSAPPQTITPHGATLDAWALTSIQKDWPLSQPLDEYLHGIADSEPPTAGVAWRKEVSIFFPVVSKDSDDNYDATQREKQFATWLDAYPLRPAEIVTDKSQRAMELLLSLGERNPDAVFLRIYRSEIHRESLESYTSDYKKRDSNGQNQFCRDIADCTFILPTELGGLKQGMIDPASTDSVHDVADVSGDRFRVRLHPDAEGDFTATWLGIPDAEPAIFPPAKLDSWTEWRDNAANNGRKQVISVQLKNADGDLIDILLSFRKWETATSKNERVPLADHLNDAGKFAMQFARALDTKVEPAVLQLAAEWHDLGKRPEKWQKSIRNRDLTKPLAKSWGKGMDVDSLNGYRHEFGSLIEITKNYLDKLNNLQPDQKDLLLHLITTHHGRGRPDFPQGAFDADNPSVKIFGELISPGEIARRYARLQLKYGHWGLAWHESLMMCSDHAASRGDEPEDTQ